MKRCLVLLNPSSGRGNNWKKYSYVCQQLSKQYNVESKISSNLNEFENIIFLAANEVDLLVIMGGDGTMHKAINTLIGLDKIPTIGYIPIGTMCDMGINLGIPKNIRKAVRILLEGEVRPWSVSKVNDVIMTYIMAKGKMVSASYDTDCSLKKMGRVAYALNGFNGLFESKKFSVEIIMKDKKISTDCCFLGIINGRSIANLRLKKHYHVLVLFKKWFLWSSLRIALFRTLTNTPNCLVIDLNQQFMIKVKNDSTEQWSFDGEKTDISNEDVINVYPNFASINIIYNKKYKVIS